MRILHIIQRYPPAVGGSETWCQEICRYLASSGEEVKVLTLNLLSEEEYWREIPPQERIMQVGRIDWDDQVLVRRYRRSLPIPTLHSLFLERFLDQVLNFHFSGPHSIEMYGRLFAEVKAADVVHLNTLPYPHNFVGWLAAKLLRKRVVITPHFHPDHPHYERWATYQLLKHCDVVFTVSEFERTYLMAKGVDPTKLVVTGNGIHLNNYVAQNYAQFRAKIFESYHLAEDTKIVLFLGRKAEYKDLPTLIEAVKQLRNQHKVALFLVGPSLDWFRTFYTRLSEEEKRNIFDLGQVSHQEKVNLLHLATVLVLPSPFEAFGIVFLEAWACGTPVIGADNPAIAELIEGAGLTFQPKNVNDLTGKISRLLDDERLAEDMAMRGREKIVKKYQWERLGATVRRSYRSHGGQGMRILICSNLFPPHSLGGSEVVAYKQGKILKAWGHEVRVFCGRLVGNPLQRYKTKVEEGEFHTTWIGITPQDLGGLAQSLLNTKIRNEFSRVLDEYLPDIVHFHNITGLSIQVIDACREKAIPTVMTLHDYWGICFKNLMIKNDGRLCMKGGFDCLGCLEMLSGDPPLPSPVRNGHILRALGHIGCFISPSHYLAERFTTNGLPAERMRVIPNGIDLDNFRSSSRSSELLALGYVGQLVKHKGVDFLLRALSLLKDPAKVHLTIAGDGEEATYLKSLSHELDLDRWVTFVGRVDNNRIASLYETFDVLIVPSVWPENSPVVITEAMASGIPVIASDMGGIGELVEDEVTGFLVPPRDVKALAERIEHLMHHPETRRRMGAQALEKIKAHELQGQVGRVLDVYRELLVQEGARAPLEVDVLLYQAGNHWDLRVREALYQIADLESYCQRRILPCRFDLSDEEMIRSAKILLIPSADQSSSFYALQAFRRGIPILVQEQSWELKELCLASNAGLFYADAGELKECLTLLFSNEPLRQGLGENGRKFFEDQSAPAIT